jgi:serine/threonine protein kinase
VLEALIDGKYRLEERIGDGAMGVVYRALHLHLRRTVAVKLLSTEVPDTEAVLRFQREAEALGRLRHPSVVDVIDFGIDDAEHRPYLVMEYLDGASLDTLRVEPAEALPILEAVASALDHAHAMGVLHRDLKPENVMVWRDGGGPRVKVLDFGLARFVGDDRERDPAAGVARAPADATNLTGSGAIVGTPLYAAPEVVQGRPATRASDIYSFGVLAYQLLTGRAPFVGTTAEVLAAHRERTPPDPCSLNKALPTEAGAALLSALEKEPDRRPPSATRVVERVRDAARQAELRVRRRRDRSRRVAAVALLCAAFPLTALVWPSPLLQSLEHRSQDARFALRSNRPADPRILLLTVDEPSLAAVSRPLADRADEFGRELERVFQAGAHSIAIDFVLPERWSQSTAFSDLVVSHADRLTLAALAGPDGRIIGARAIAGLPTTYLGPDAASALFGLANVQEDGDGVVRRGRLGFRDQSGSVRRTWAARAAETMGHDLGPGEDKDGFFIDHAIEWRAFAGIPWRDLAATLDRNPGIVEGRLVMLGGERISFGDDSHHVPDVGARGRTMSGLVLQALITQTILEGRQVRSVAARVPFLIAWGGCCLAVLGILFLARPWIAWVLLVVAGCVWCLASALLLKWNGLMLPVVGPLASALLVGVFASVARRALGSDPEET